jgi:hypothetical protein
MDRIASFFLLIILICSVMRNINHQIREKGDGRKMKFDRMICTKINSRMDENNVFDFSVRYFEH